jgi:hypothetical protein
MVNLTKNQQDIGGVISATDVREFRALYRGHFGRRITAREATQMLAGIAELIERLHQSTDREILIGIFQPTALERTKAKSGRSTKAATAKGAVYSKAILRQHLAGKKGA